MKHSKFILLFGLFVCFFTFFSKSEEIKKIKTGKITMEELLMKSYDKDTSAEAVVLYQSAEFIPQQFAFYQYYRIKILKKTGTSSGSMVFGGRLKYFISGASYNLENGKIVKTKLTQESIFEEKVVGNIYRTRIAMPNVKEGTVFEINIQQDGIPYVLEIQRNIPVIYGAIKFPYHPQANIRINEIGYLGYTYKDKETWIVKDLPAFKPEPYITSENDYRVRMEFDLLSINISEIRGFYNEFFATSWGAVTKKFQDSEYFGDKVYSSPLFLNSLVDSLKQLSSNTDDLAKNAFEAIKKINWNENKACFVSQELKRTYQQKQGNSADININLIVLLRKLGLKSYPVLFSTRDNGKISKYSPTLNKFNYVIAAVDLASGTKYLDATDEFIPYGLTTERISGCLGHPIQEGKMDCSVYIDPEKKQKKLTYSQLNLDSTGRITGKITIKRFDYNAMDFKHYLKSKPDHETYIQELESENSGWYIDNHKFTNLNDPYKDFTDEYDINYSNSLSSSDVLIINPFVLIKSKNNPFQRDSRNLPISFPEKTEYSSTITLSIPSNYVVSELPNNTDITNNDKTIRFTYQIQNIGKSVSITSKFYINKLKYETIEYLSLRGIFEMMLQKQNESIVLKKI